MTLRPATAAEAGAIAAFLSEHAESSIFLRASLQRFGPEGAENSRAMRLWVSGGDVVEGVIGHAPSGYVAVQCPGGVPGDLPATFAGLQVLGVSGPFDQAARAADLLGLGAVPHSEPLYRLPLDALRVPEGPGTLRPARAEDFGWLGPWRQAYRRELDGFETTGDELREWYDAWTRDDRLRVLDDHGTPLAITGFNATLPDTVQVGAVYTPPERRGRGHARRAVALHLAEARAKGVSLAVLFASGPAACRTYEGIGFARIGLYGILQLQRPRRIGA